MAMLRAASIQRSLCSSLSSSIAHKEVFRSPPLLLNCRFCSHDDFPRYELATNFGVCIVPEKKAYIIERFGNLMDKVAYVKEKPIHFPQSGLTKDKVNIVINGVLFEKLRPYVVEQELLQKEFIYIIAHTEKWSVCSSKS